MFGLLINRKVIFSGILLLVVTSLFGYYFYQMNDKSNQIIELKNKSIEQNVKINNLGTTIRKNKVETKNKLFEVKQVQIKKQVQKEIKDVTKKDNDINCSIGSHNINL